MTDKITKETLFRATRSQAESKADITNNAARAIIDADTQRRDAKTARLRQTRLERAGATIQK